MTSAQAQEFEFFNVRYPDHWDTLQIQIALIASFFANLYSTKKDKTKWDLMDFIPNFEKPEKFEKPKKQDPIDISSAALRMASLFGDNKTKAWAEKKIHKNGKNDIDDKSKYQLEEFVKETKKLPVRLRKTKDK